MSEENKDMLFVALWPAGVLMVGFAAYLVGQFIGLSIAGVIYQ